MFCSKCGKTVKTEDTVCASCGVKLGESRMDGSTSIQPIYAPDAAPEEDSKFAPYTRLSYSTVEVEDDDVYSRTSYRPALKDDEQAPEEMANGDADQEKAAETAAQEEEVQEEQPAPKIRYKGISPEDMEEPADEDEDDDGEYTPIELEPIAEKGIDPEIEEFIQKLDEKKKTKKTRSRRAKEEPVEEPEETEEPAEEDSKETDEEPVYEDTEDEEEEEAPKSRAEAKKARQKHAKSANMRKWILAAVAVLLVAAVGVFGFMLVNTIVNSSQIPGVTKELRETGIALLEEHMGDSYRAEFIKLFKEDESGTTVFTKQDEDKAVIQALLPETPSENDQAFIDAMLRIQNSIDGATMVDALTAVSTTGETTAMKAQSVQTWDAISAAVNRLKNCTTLEELNAITVETSGDTTAAGVLSGTDSTTDSTEGTESESQYQTLSKGMKNSSAVKMLQQRLYDLGYFNGKLDGAYGDVTRRAVKLFQQDAGLTADGVATPETQEILYSDDAPRTGLKATAAPEATEAPAEEETESTESDEDYDDIALT